LFEHEFSSAVESIIKLDDTNKYNVSLGFFNGYSTEDVDSSGSRFANLKLHYRDLNGDEITAVSVPIMYQGNKETVDDFKLTSGDELLVLFTDRTLEQWTQKQGTVPQKINNKVKDSLNHALCIPISTHHSLKPGITSLPIDSTVARRIIVTSGKKIQIGNDTDELLKIMHQFLDFFQTIIATDGDTFATNLVTGQAGLLSTIKAQLANITKL